MRTERFMYFCIKRGTQGEVCRQSKYLTPLPHTHPPPLPGIYATDRSKAVVPVLFYGALHVLKSFRALCPRVSSFLLAL